ncbi:MAG: class I SAM-dependent methyltransferase [Gammaproteobacteria bacterium]
MTKTDDFANRLRKNAKHWDKWARRQGLSCYRLYDRDLPDFPLAIDRYAEHVHLQEYATAWEAGEDEYRVWREACFQTVEAVLEVPRPQIHFKQRRRQRGTAQYQKTGTTGEDFMVEEQGLRFWVNLDAYLDSGLFLDHRITRRWVRERAAGRRFLNLFAYTGSFTVYAAAGGAAGSVTVDLSNTYQDWSRRNFALNGLDPARHALTRADVTQYLGEACWRREQYDLIVMDPPSFSNSKKMQGVLDVQRDHVALILGCLRLLAPDGELFFSNNRRGFTLDAAALTGCEIRDISRQTVPEDFSNKQIHQCWIIRHADARGPL